jgi:hypothetical protein
MRHERRGVVTLQSIAGFRKVDHPHIPEVRIASCPNRPAMEL